MLRPAQNKYPAQHDSGFYNACSLIHLNDHLYINALFSSLSALDRYMVAYRYGSLANNYFSNEKIPLDYLLLSSYSGLLITSA